MNELIGSFAGKRLAAFGALIAAIALLAAGGALSTAQAHNPAGASPTSEPAATGRAGSGLDFIRGGQSVNDLTITLAVGTEAEVCLMDDLAAQQFRADSDNGPHAPNADPPTEDAAGDTPGDPADIDDWDWGLAPDSLEDADEDPDEAGPVGVLTTVPSATGSGALSRNPTTGWNWVISKKANTAGTPTLTNPVRRFPNQGDAGEACVFWTSNAPGTQVIQLFRDTQLAASGAGVYNHGSRGGDNSYTAGLPDPLNDDETVEQRHLRADHEDSQVATDWAINAPESQLEITWVDSDPLIRLARLGLPTAPLGAPVGDAPIPQRMVLNGSGATQSFVPAGATPATIRIRVEAIQSAVAAQALTGASVSFAVTGNCGSVNVPNAIISAGPPVVKDDIGPGQTGTIAEWGTSSVTATFSNTGSGAAACKRPSSNTTLTVTSGSATATVAVNWDWDGYGEFTVDDVDDTTKKVTFHTAIPRTYVLGQPTGWTCDDASKARVVNFDLDGRASVAGFARRNTVGTDGPTFAAVMSTTQGATTPKRTLGATDSECQVSWTVRSPARADDVYLDVSSLGVDTLSRLLSFAPAVEPVTTFDDLEDPLDPSASTSSSGRVRTRPWPTPSAIRARPPSTTGSPRRRAGCRSSPASAGRGRELAHDAAAGRDLRGLDSEQLARLRLFASVPVRGGGGGAAADSTANEARSDTRSDQTLQAVRRGAGGGGAAARPRRTPRRGARPTPRPCPTATFTGTVMIDGDDGPQRHGRDGHAGGRDHLRHRPWWAGPRATASTSIDAIPYAPADHPGRLPDAKSPSWWAT